MRGRQTKKNVNPEYLRQWCKEEGLTRIRVLGQKRDWDCVWKYLETLSLYSNKESSPLSLFGITMIEQTHCSRNFSSSQCRSSPPFATNSASHMICMMSGCVANIIKEHLG